MDDFTPANDGSCQTNFKPKVFTPDFVRRLAAVNCAARMLAQWQIGIAAVAMQSGDFPTVTLAIDPARPITGLLDATAGTRRWIWNGDKPARAVAMLEGCLVKWAMPERLPYQSVRRGEK